MSTKIFEDKWIRCCLRSIVVVLTVMFVSWSVCVSGLEMFDTRHLPDGAELIPMKVSEIRMKEPAGNKTAINHTDHMPVAMNVDFVYQGQHVYLQFNFQEKSLYSGNSTEAEREKSIPTTEELPVFTKSGKSNTVYHDGFPRLFSGKCRIFQDSKNQAAFIAIQDPVFKSYKFYGSFTLNGSAYFVQPYALYNTSQSQRMHVSLRVPHLDLRYNIKSPEPFTKEEADEKINKLNNRDPLGVDLNVITGLLSSVLTGSSNVLTTELSQQLIDLHQESSYSMSQLRATNNKLSFQDNSKPRYTQERDSQVYSHVTETSESHKRLKRQTVNNYTVEVVIVCDYLCFLKFQEVYGITGEVETKNTIALFFSYVREVLDISYSSVYTLYPQLNTNISVTVPAIFIASSPDVKVIGDYVLGENKAVDTTASLYEFAVWVQDSLKVSLNADHYTLVTGYDLYSNRAQNAPIGRVTRIPNVCDLDSVSLVETKFLTLTPITIVHELGHSLGAQHDSKTEGFCQDTDQFIMMSQVGGIVPIQNQSHIFSFSFCSALYFSTFLPSKQCLLRQDFNTSLLPETISLLGQEFPLENQCALRLDGSTLCRRAVVELEGSWDRVCASKQCKVPFLKDRCFSTQSLQYTSCGNKRWCIGGYCVDDPSAPEKPVDCPAGDSPTVTCDAGQCLSYSNFTRFVLCCDTCRPVKTERFVSVS